MNMSERHANASSANYAITHGTGRGNFLRILGAGLLLPMAGCRDYLMNPTLEADIDLATENGAVNFAYALKQLTEDFYRRVLNVPFAGMTTAEFDALNAIRTHETAHREYFRGWIRPGKISDVLRSDFSTLDFSVRRDVMTTARDFEDLSVAALNGVMAHIRDAGHLELLAKIVSVEARHAATIRHLIYLSGAGGSATDFAGDDVVDPATGGDRSIPPHTVVAELNRYYTTRFTLRGQ
jgi:hypothetical protein